MNQEKRHWGSWITQDLNANIDRELEFSSSLHKPSKSHGPNFEISHRIKGLSKPAVNELDRNDCYKDEPGVLELFSNISKKKNQHRKDKQELYYFKKSVMWFGRKKNPLKMSVKVRFWEKNECRLLFWRQNKRKSDPSKKMSAKVTLRKNDDINFD